FLRGASEVCRGPGHAISGSDPIWGAFMSRTQSAGPLQGIRIVDLTSLVMGPYATQMLADYGADVIKVEAPGGDVMRKTGPMRNPDMGAMSLQMNRNKRSIVLDLKQPRARDALIKLCAGADVFIHNVRLRSLRKLGLGPEELRAANARLIYASLIGFGETG